jgi:putative glutamine amidotransferase
VWKTFVVARPLIAISARSRQPGEVANWPGTRAAVMQQTYLDGVWRAGGNDAMIAPRPMTTDDAKEILCRVDGLVLVGGGDVDPALFGQPPHEQVYGVDADSDSLEIALVRAATDLGVPTLAICRGMQVLNVAFGGTLLQHITREPGFGPHGDPREGFALHRVSVEPATHLAKAVGGAPTIEQCWSFHHQAIDRVADGLRITATSDDGTIEAVEWADPEQPWMMAVQWHPERRAHTDHVQQSLFDELIRQATN